MMKSTDLIGFLLGGAVGAVILLGVARSDHPAPTHQTAPPPVASAPAAAPFYLGLQPDFVDGHWVVEALSDGGPAQRAGIDVGDIILEADGKVPLQAQDMIGNRRRLRLRTMRAGAVRSVLVERQSRSELWRNVGIRLTPAGGFSYLDPPLAVGDPLGPWTLTTIDGEELHLSGDESVTFVLWAPYCGASVDRLLALAKDPALSGRLIGLTWGIHLREVEDWRRDQGLSLPIVLLGPMSRLGARLGMYDAQGGVPGPQVFTFVDGRLAARDAGQDLLPGERPRSS